MRETIRKEARFWWQSFWRPCKWTLLACLVGMFVLSVIDTLQKADTQAGDWLALWGMSGVIEGRGDALHPGTVCTDLSAPFRRSPKTLFSVERAAKQLQRIVDEASLEMNGSFIAWDGQPIPW